MTAIALHNNKLWLPKFEPWRLLRPLKLNWPSGQFKPFSPIQFEEDISYIASSGPDFVAFKGAGWNRVSAATLPSSYGNVISGSAPAAGDFVLWMCVGENTSGTYASPSGWTRNVTSNTTVAAFSKIAAAGDISSPPSLHTGGDGVMVAMWICYTVQSVTTTTHFSYTGQGSNTSAPSNQSIAASGATGPLISASLGTGTDGSIGLGWSGATASQSPSAANIGGGTQDVIAFVKTYANGVSGEAITASKPDDGSFNALISLYVTIS